MATNFTTSTQGGQREDLANWISTISRDMTPFVSSIGKGKASATLHEWSTDTLEAAGLQAAAEGRRHAFGIQHPGRQHLAPGVAAGPLRALTAQ